MVLSCMHTAVTTQNIEKNKKIFQKIQKYLKHHLKESHNDLFLHKKG